MRCRCFKSYRARTPARTDSAKKIGLMDSTNGIHFLRNSSSPIQPPASDAESPAIVENAVEFNSTPLVTPEDKTTITEFLFLVMQQVRPCRSANTDLPCGIECKHCADEIGGRNFWFSMERAYAEVEMHMLGCQYISDPLKMELTRLNEIRKEKASMLEYGSKEAFFARVWARIHGGLVPPMPIQGSTDERGRKRKKIGTQF